MVSIAAQRDASTDSSVASTVASKSGVELAVGERAIRRGREGDEDLTAPVVGDRARTREAEAGAAREPLELGSA